MGILDAIGYVGDSLDKAGGRPLRGVLGGKPREALSFVPFSDRFGLTDPNEIVTGRHLTDRAGLTAKGDDSLLSSALGFGAEMALDPSNFVGLGAAKAVSNPALKLLGKSTSPVRKLLPRAASHSGDDLARLSSHAHDASLGLKYDPEHLPGVVGRDGKVIRPPDAWSPDPLKDHGLLRSDPEWVNNRTFYHGTATPDLHAGNLDPLKTKPKSLFGRGVYTTDEAGRATADPVITSGYARSGHKKIAAPSGLAAPPRPVIYQGQSDFGKILDLDEIPSKSTHDALAGAIRDGGYDFPEHFEYHDDGPVRDLVRWMIANGVNQQSDGPDLLIQALKGEGYDALTHTGGADKVPHQVVIGLDPNDVLGLGRKTPYKQWTPFASPLPGDDLSLLPPHPASPQKAMKVDPWGGAAEQALTDAATAYGPRHPGGTGKLRDIFAGLPDERADAMQYVSRDVAAEVPPGSSLLGQGGEAVALSSPQGHVVRIGSTKPWRTTARAGIDQELGRAAIPEVLQPGRSVRYGDTRVEHLPLVHPVHRGAPDRHALSAVESAVAGVPANPADAARLARAQALLDRLGVSAQGISRELADRIRGHGLDPWDVAKNPTNVSLTAEGNALVHDAGAVWTHNPLDRNSAPTSLLYPPPMPPAPDAHLLGQLNAAGAPLAVQDAIRAGLSTAGQGVPLDELFRGRPPASAADLLGHRQEFADLAARYGVSLAPRPPAPALDPAGLLAALNRFDDRAIVASDLAPLKAGGVRQAGGVTKHTHGGMDIYRNVPNNFEGADALMGGRYVPDHKSAIVYNNHTSPGLTTRHEIGHGRVDLAARAGAGAVAKLPLAWQPAAWAKLAAGNRPGPSRFARWIDEATQRGTEHRGLMNQVRGTADFLSSHALQADYAKHLGAGPLLTTLMSAAPWANRNRGALALGALGSADLAKLAAALQRGDQPPGF